MAQAQGYIDDSTLYTLIENQETTYVVKFDGVVQLAVRFSTQGHIQSISDEEAEDVVERIITLTA